MRGIVPLLLLLLLAFTLSCGGSKSQTEIEHHLPDTLVVGTLYSPTGFFILKGDTMGYDYDRICDFARSATHLQTAFKQHLFCIFERKKWCKIKKKSHLYTLKTYRKHGFDHKKRCR
jgi:hypothetical protein